VSEKCYQKKWLGFIPTGVTHHTDVVNVRVTHRTVTQTDDQISFPLGPRTVVHKKCNACGAVWTKELYGKWELEDL
jgi:hypothetical protein